MSKPYYENLNILLIDCWLHKKIQITCVSEKFEVLDSTDKWQNTCHKFWIFQAEAECLMTGSRKDCGCVSIPSASCRVTTWPRQQPCSMWCWYGDLGHYPEWHPGTLPSFYMDYSWYEITYICFLFTCIVRLLCFEAWWSQWLQAYLTPSWTDWIWVVRLLCCVAW